MPIEFHRTQILEIPSKKSMAMDTTYPIVKLNGNVYALVGSSESRDFDSISNNMCGGSAGEIFIVYDYQRRKQLVAKSNKPTIHTPTNSTLYESECLASLNHPNIVRHMGLAYKENPLIPGMREIFYLMEYHERTLNEQIPYFQKVSDVLKIAIQVAGALSCMHTEDIVHGDINPGNILLDKKGNALICDFGITTRLFTLNKINSRQIGTNGYAPPEQYNGTFSKKNDAYGLAAVTHQLLTRTDPRIMPPFAAYEDLMNRKPFCQSFMDQLGNRYESIRKTLVDALNPNPEERITVEAIRHNILVSSITNPSMIKTL